MENIPSNSVGAELICKYIFGTAGDVQEACSWLVEQVLDVNSPNWNTSVQCLGGSHGSSQHQHLSLGRASTATSPWKEVGMCDKGKKLAAALIMLTDKNSDIARKVLPNIAQYLLHIKIKTTEN